MTTKRIVKRYQNRKLYDTHISAYITLKEAAEFIKDGHDLVVYDNKTRNDITFMTLVQSLHEKETEIAKAGGGIGVAALNRVIRSEGGTLTNYIKKLEGIEEVVQTPEQQFEAFVQNQQQETVEQVQAQF